MNEKKGLMASVTERVKYGKFLSVAYTLHMSLCSKTPTNLRTILYLGQSFFNEVTSEYFKVFFLIEHDLLKSMDLITWSIQ